MARQFIYHMQGLSKSYAGGKKVLDNVHLQFYPEAKKAGDGPRLKDLQTIARSHTRRWVLIVVGTLLAFVGRFGGSVPTQAVCL